MRDSNPKHIPENYIHHTLTTALLVQKAKAHIGVSDSIFDLGCSSGRVLNELLALDYNNLMGCDIRKIRPSMKAHFPKLHDYFAGSSTNRLFEGDEGDFLKILPLMEESQVQIDFFITHGRTLDVVLEYRGIESFELTIQRIFSIAKKGIITVQNQWNRYYLDMAEKYNYTNAELIIGERMYAGVAERAYACGRNQLSSLERNLFYAYFKR